MGIVWRDLDRLDRDQYRPRVTYLARYQLGQIALNLVGHTLRTMGG
jgi:hypothetical protein